MREEHGTVDAVELGFVLLAGEMHVEGLLAVHAGSADVAPIHALVTTRYGGYAANGGKLKMIRASKPRGGVSLGTEKTFSLLDRVTRRN